MTAMAILRRAGAVFAAATVIAIVLVYAGPTVYCPSVWIDGTVADERATDKALEAIAEAERSPKSALRLVSSGRQFYGGRAVRELWRLETGGREVIYDVTFFYVPGGPICGPSFRTASRQRG
jgi:hypothetical protein